MALLGKQQGHILNINYSATDPRRRTQTKEEEKVRRDEHRTSPACACPHADRNVQHRTSNEKQKKMKQKTEGQGTEVGGRRSEGGGQKSVAGGQRAVGDQ